MVRNKITTFQFNETVFDKLKEVSLRTKKSRSSTLAICVDYFYDIVSTLTKLRDPRVERIRKLVVYESLGDYIDNFCFKHITQNAHVLSCRWEEETLDKLTEISRVLSVSQRVSVWLAIYAYWLSFNEEDADDIVARLEKIVAILKS